MFSSGVSPIAATAITGFGLPLTSRRLAGAAEGVSRLSVAVELTRGANGAEAVKVCITDPLLLGLLLLGLLLLWCLSSASPALALRPPSFFQALAHADLSLLFLAKVRPKPG